MWKVVESIFLSLQHGIEQSIHSQNEKAKNWDKREKVREIWDAEPLGDEVTVI